MDVTDIAMPAERSRRMMRTLDIIRRYAMGDPVDEIATAFGCTRKTVLFHARKAGLDKRPKHFSEHVKQDVLAALKTGELQKSIADRIGVSIAYVSTVGKEAGLNRYNKKRNFNDGMDGGTQKTSEGTSGR